MFLKINTSRNSGNNNRKVYIVVLLPLLRIVKTMFFPPTRVDKEEA